MTRDGRTDRVEAIDADLSRLVAPDGPPVRATETLPALEVCRSPSGATLIDFGQNLVGWVRLRVRDPKPGEEVVVRHAEVLEHGELGVRPLRTAQATDTYILAGGDGQSHPQPRGRARRDDLLDLAVLAGRPPSLLPCAKRSSAAI
jgi:alpha-L-rhamnosidase